MPEFLSTLGTSHSIEKIVVNAKTRLVLVTPYLKLSDNFFKRLIDANRRDVEITVIYGKNELLKSEREKLNSLTNLELYYCDNLHAKCYLNEDALVISSMNLHEYSEKHNREMGICFKKNEDDIIFNSALSEIDSILASSVQQKKRTSAQKELEKVDHIPNLHLEALLRHLKEDLKLSKCYQEKDELLVTNFPVKGVDMTISHRITLQFDSPNMLKKYQVKLESTSKSGNYRMYPKADHVIIYPAEKSGFEQNEDGINKKVEYFRKMIGAFSDVQLFR